MQPQTTEISDKARQYRKAYASAVAGYKPWHQHGAWNSSGNDAFWQIIKGGLDNGIFDIHTACQLFNESAGTIQQWANKAVPPRNVRIKVWKRIRAHLASMPV